MKKLLCGLVLIGSAAVAQAQNQPTANASPVFDFMYHFDVSRNDDGLKVDAKQDLAYTTVQLHGFHLGVRGDIDKNLKYRARVNLIGTQGSRFDLGYIEWLSSTKTWQAVVGIQKINVFGFEQKEFDPLTIIESVGRGENAPPFFQNPAVSLSFLSEVGAFTVQVVQDSMGDKNWNAGSGTTTQTAGTFEWMASGIEIDSSRLIPLVQVATHDAGHSRSLTVGVEYKADNGFASLDYVQDIDGNKVLDVSSGRPDNKNGDDVRTHTVVRGQYDAGGFSPFVHVAFYNLKEYTAEGVEQVRVNATGKFNDNASTMAAGLFFNTWSAKLRPYASLQHDSGKFKNVDLDDESMNRNIFRIGLEGKF